MFCGSCGTKNPDINKFCRECGAKLPERANRTLSEDQFADLREPTPSPPVDNAKVAVLMDVAFSYHREGKIDQAIETCVQAISLNPRSTSAHSLLAILYEERGQFDLAVTHLQRVLDLNPASVADQERLSRLLGDAPAPVQQTGAAKSAPKVPLWVRARDYPLATAVGVGFVVCSGLVLASTSMLKMKPADDAGNQPTRPNLPPPAYRSIESAVRERESGMSMDAPGQRAAAPAPQPGIAPADETVPPPPAPPRSTAEATPTAPTAPLAPPRQPPTLPGEEQVEPLPPPERRQPTAPPVIMLPPRQRTQPAVAARETPAPRRSEPIDFQLTVEPSAGRSPMRATPAPERVAPTPTPVPVQPSGPRANIRVHEPTPTDYQEWGMTAQARGDYENAISSFRRALDGARSSRDRGKIQQHMAYAYQQLGRNTDAETAYRSAISAYEEQIRQGGDDPQARSSIRSCQDGLRTIGP